MVCIRQVVDAAPFASVAMLFAGNEVRDLFRCDLVEPGLAASRDRNDQELQERQ